MTTALILVMLFSWTFFVHADRTVPALDPAYYTWKTEALLVHEPRYLVESGGPLDMFARGYRIQIPVLGAYLRQIGGVAPLKTTVVLAVLLPVTVALLLAGFAYRWRRDPLLFHCVAFGAGGLFFSRAFIGYIDNLLCLLFVICALYFVDDARREWVGRIVFGALLFLAGMSHPTTMAVFLAALGAATSLRWLGGRARLYDGSVLLVALGAAVAVALAWAAGVWGPSAWFADAALPPPHEREFLVRRLGDWLVGLRPALNGPLLVAGVAGLLAGGRRALEDDFTSFAVAWLLPVAGMFGFVVGLSYPYYRLLNATPAWVVLVGVGAWFVLRFLLATAARGGMARLSYLGVGAVVLILGTNFTFGAQVTGRNDPATGWMSNRLRADLDVLRRNLLVRGEARPLVFVADDEPDIASNIWGFAKLTGNRARYGLPPEMFDRAHLYLGSLDNYLAARPTVRGESTYDRVSQAFFDDIQAAIRGSNADPIVVVAAGFNRAGSNRGIAERPPLGEPSDQEIWYLHDRGLVITRPGHSDAAGAGVLTAREEPSPLDPVRTVLGLTVLLVPGAVAVRRLRAGIPEALGLIPALSVATLTLSGIVMLSLTRAPFSTVAAVIAFVGAIGAALILRPARAAAPGPKIA